MIEVNSDLRDALMLSPLLYVAFGVNFLPSCHPFGLLPFQLVAVLPIRRCDGVGIALAALNVTTRGECGRISPSRVLVSRRQSTASEFVA